MLGSITGFSTGATLAVKKAVEAGPLAEVKELAVGGAGAETDLCLASDHGTRSLAAKPWSADRARAS
jgi:hypothetical protein